MHSEVEDLPVLPLTKAHHAIADWLQGDRHRLTVNLRRRTEIDRYYRTNLLGKRNRRGLRIRRAVHGEQIRIARVAPCAHGDIAV